MAMSIVVELPCMEYACCFPNLESVLDYAVSSFLYTDPEPDLTLFRSLFERILKSYHDPPFEAAWFFSAIRFRDVPDAFIAMLDLIYTLTHASPAIAKPLALLAPVVSRLFHSDKPRKDIDDLVGILLTYILRICKILPAGGSIDADAGMLFPSFQELVKTWIPRDSSDDPFKVLFPLAGDDARRELMKEGCSVNFLAGVVVAEAFLFRLCFKVKDAAVVPRSELIAWAIGVIQGIMSQQFCGILLNMLLNPPLPVYSSLSADDVFLVRDVLRDALIFSDYSVLGQDEIDQADSSLFPIFLSRLVITFDAITDARHKGDDESAVLSYIEAFSASDIPRYLTSWASSQLGADQLGEVKATTPQAFLMWLVDLDDQGVIVLGENRSSIKGRLMHAEVQNDNQSRRSQSDDDLFIIRKQSHQVGMDTIGGEDEKVGEMETADNYALMAGAHFTKVMEDDTKKRKDCGAEDATVAKLVKYKSEGSSVKDYLQATYGMDSGREVENLQSDDEMEEAA